MKKEFESLVESLQGHATYENEQLHEQLRKKNSPLYKAIEQDHEELDEQVIFLRNALDAISSNKAAEDKVEAGYQFYLEFRKFVGQNLIHLHEEETIILPELQRLYSDDELRNVEFRTYAIMSPEDLISMLEELFPHMNAADHEVFLRDIKDSQPEKFPIVWQAIASKINKPEREELHNKLNS